MKYEYMTIEHHRKETFDMWINQSALNGWEPFLFSHDASETGKLGGFASMMRRQLSETSGD